MDDDVKAFRSTLQSLARMFRVSARDVVPRLSTATLRHLDWKLDAMPLWVLRDERFAVKAELLDRDIADIAASVGGYVVHGYGGVE